MSDYMFFKISRYILQEVVCALRHLLSCCPLTTASLQEMVQDGLGAPAPTEWSKKDVEKQWYEVTVLVHAVCKEEFRTPTLRFVAR